MFRAFLLFALLVIQEAAASSIIIHNKSAEVWNVNQVVRGELTNISASEITVYHNHRSFKINVQDGNNFSFEVFLNDQENKIWIEAYHSGIETISDTLFFTLGYKPQPIVKPLVQIDGSTATLSASVIENPYTVPLSYFWFADDRNPAASFITNEQSANASVSIPSPSGIYYFNLLVVAEEDSSWFQTYIMREEEKITAFEIDKDHPYWMKDAVIYEITPYNFVADGKFKDITEKLPEIKSLGINTLWIQPVYKSSYKGQGYDVVDYFGINPDLGTEEDLEELIMKAKELGFRVLFDLVLNHTSIEHPYAKDKVARGSYSHYHDYYQTIKDAKPYSVFYNTHPKGFIYYFWDDLVNLNYDHDEVQRWMLEVCKHWVKRFNIDGYRLDAIWGVNARAPSFARRLRTELKSMKPDLLLLAEDKGSDPQVYELGYDAAFDWTTSKSWVSQWSWEYEYSATESKTVFNHPDEAQRSDLLKKALFESTGDEFRKLRFMENNDIHRFIHGHGLERTKMVSSLLFSIPGIPMLYQGQEAGFHGHPYFTNAVFQRNRAIQVQDQRGLFSHYQKLMHWRNEYPALKGVNMEPVDVSSEEALVAFHRWENDEHFIIILNLSEKKAQASVKVNNLFSENFSSKGYRLEDLFTGNLFRVNMETYQAGMIMEPYSARWLLLKEEGEVTSTKDELPQEFVIFPNPSNGFINIKLPSASFNRIMIKDLFGRMIMNKLIAPQELESGINIQLPASAYIVQISDNNQVLTKKIIIQK